MKKFLVSTFLSGMCLVFSAPVFAGNGQSRERINVNDIVERLDAIDKNIVFSSVDSVLKNLESIFRLSMDNRQDLSYSERKMVSNWFRYILKKIVPVTAKERQVRDDLLVDSASLFVLSTRPKPFIVRIPDEVYEEMIEEEEKVYKCFFRI